MKRRSAIAGALGAVALPGRSASTPVVLPRPRSTGPMSLEDALAQRRSGRSFSTRPLALETVAQLLWAAQGTTASGGRRTAPSAGALYPLALHLVAERVDGLSPGVFRYDAATHALQSTLESPIVAALMRAAGGQPAVGAAAAVVVIAAVEQRTARKYGARAGRYVVFEAGAASQNLALQAAARGLATVVIGSFDDAALADLLRLGPGEHVLALMPVGWRPG